jgi:hypothetical protein
MGDKSEEERAKMHLRNCKRVVKGFKELSHSLEALGGSVWVLASIPHHSVDDIDNAYGVAAHVLAADMDKRGVCLASLLRSNQQYVDLDRNPGFSRSLQNSTSIQEYFSRETIENQSDTGDTVQNQNQSGAYKRLNEQNKVRDMLKKHCLNANISLTATGRFPHRFWKDYTITNWPENLRAMAELKSFTLDECQRAMNADPLISIDRIKCNSEDDGRTPEPNPQRESETETESESESELESELASESESESGMNLRSKRSGTLQFDYVLI